MMHMVHIVTIFNSYVSHNLIGIGLDLREFAGENLSCDTSTVTSSPLELQNGCGARARRARRPWELDEVDGTMSWERSKVQGN